MRIFILLASATTLAACGGGGPQSVGSVAPPTSVGGSTPTPTSTHTFVTPVDAKTYQGIGAVQHYGYNTRSDRSGQTQQLYAGDANTVRDSGITVAYDPRDAIFNISIARPQGIVTTGSLRFQDPVHRTAFGGAREPQVGVPQLSEDKQIQYLQAGTSTGDAINAPGRLPVGADKFTGELFTMFYQKPGTTTKYVTYGGYVHSNYGVAKQSEQVIDPTTGKEVTNEYLLNSYALDRAVYAYGERTDIGAVPKSGSGTYSGDMIASMVYNVLLDTDRNAPTYYQWIEGKNMTTVDFGTLGVTSALTGTVQAPAIDAYTSGAYAIAAGTTFTASAKATIDLIGTGGFTGTVTDARFTPAGGGTDLVVNIAGSSFDGAFFGPGAQELGAGFRIVGGTPDQRIDIVGAVTGKK